MTVRQLLANLDTQELVEWQAYFKMQQDQTGNSPEATSENVKIAFEGMKR